MALLATEQEISPMSKCVISLVLHEMYRNVIKNIFNVNKNNGKGHET